ncbi:MAG: hypothetical protein JNL21_36590 [Myxococcales bacterium]|nr:hypothetical protein [Myxococcales bacterium]
MNRSAVVIAFALGVSLSAGARPSPAQPADPARDPAGAEALFKRGLEALEKDDWATACPQFEASLKLDPSVGAQINVARCAEHDGKLARAWAEYQKARVLNRETAGAKRKKEVDAFLDDAITKLEPRLPYVTVTLARRPEGLRVERDGIELPLEGLGVAVPVDPGRHVFTATAPGHRGAREEIDLAESARREVVLDLVRDPSALPSAQREPSGGTGDGRRSATAPAEPGIPFVLIGAIVGSVGAATLAVSAITGGVAASDHATIDDLESSRRCGASGDVLTCRDSAALTQASDAAERGQTLSVTSTVTLFVGGIIAATGLTLVIVGSVGDSGGATAEAAFHPLLLPGGGGVGLVGSF